MYTRRRAAVQTSRFRCRNRPTRGIWKPSHLLPESPANAGFLFLTARTIRVDVLAVIRLPRRAHLAWWSQAARCPSRRIRRRWSGRAVAEQLLHGLEVAGVVQHSLPGCVPGLVHPLAAGRALRDKAGADPQAAGCPPRCWYAWTSLATLVRSPPSFNATSATFTANGLACSHSL